MKADNRKFVRQICRIGNMMYQKSLVAGTAGNISCRGAGNEILITVAGSSKGRLQPKDVVAVNQDGEILAGNGQPSTEYRLHLRAYEARQDFLAAVHAHPPYATAFACAGIRIDVSTLPELESVFGDIPLVRYEPPGTEALARSLDPLINKHHSFLLENHGVICFGADLDQAYDRLETLEHCARILCLSKSLQVSGDQPPGRHS